LAVKISTVINTYKEESIHPSRQPNPYFQQAMDNRAMGGLDIFMSKRQPNGEWGTPVNLGYPINTFSE